MALTTAYINSARSIASTQTNNSQSTSYNTSLQSSQHSQHRTNLGSSTTIYPSSQQSDSLFNEPTRRASARMLTTSFTNKQKHDSRQKFYRDLSTPNKQQSSSNIPRTEKITSSTSNLSHSIKFIFFSRSKIINIF